MDFSAYLNLCVKIDLNSGWYYYGKIISVDENFISLIDKNNKRVTISVKDVSSMREVSNGF